MAKKKKRPACNVYIEQFGYFYRLDAVEVGDELVRRLLEPEGEA